MFLLVSIKRLRDFGSSLWDFTQRPVVLNVAAIVSGLIGVFLFAPLLIVCEIALIVDFYSYGKSRNDTYSWYQYLLFFLLTTGILGGIGYEVQKQMPHIPTVKEMGDYIVGRLSQQGAGGNSTTNAPRSEEHTSEL